MAPTLGPEYDREGFAEAAGEFFRIGLRAAALGLEKEAGAVGHYLGGRRHAVHHQLLSMKGISFGHRQSMAAKAPFLASHNLNDGAVLP